MIALTVKKGRTGTGDGVANEVGEKRTPGGLLASLKGSFTVIVAASSSSESTLGSRGGRPVTIDVLLDSDEAVAESERAR